ncbi:MAG: hypothetical protein IGS48_18550 [Oscillatoriales cyanobacterium C42_A2020_001]|nr:hypothetical protein [Leptolyngbyaceae cyanobacterium C42_A2020_001]
MTQNVTQWLDEIKTLKQQLAEAQREREEAYASAINWQRLYETEAQQRRMEAAIAKQTIETLQQEVQKLKGYTFAEPGSDTDLDRIQSTVEGLNTSTELKSHLIQALAECDRLTKALQTEQTNHAQTRKSLTTALGDAIDALSKKEDK